MDGRGTGLASEAGFVYQRLICWGDSQTFGSRLRFGLPEVLAQELTLVTDMEWVAVNRAVPGETTLQILRRFEDGWVDSALQTVLVGANDARDETPLPVFQELVTQLHRKVRTTGVPYVWCEIPEVARFGHFPYTRESGNHLIGEYNEILRSVVPPGRLVSVSLMADDYVDGVHLASSGLNKLAGRITSWVLDQ